MEIFNYVNSKETESLAKMAVEKSAWIEEKPGEIIVA